MLQHLRNFTACKHEELEAVMRAKLPDVLSDAQKRNQVKNLLADLSRRNLIAPERKGPGARWRLVPQNALIHQDLSVSGSEPMVGVKPGICNHNGVV